MNHQVLEVEKDRFFLNDPCKYMLQGVLPEGAQAEAWLDTKPLKVLLHPITAKNTADRIKEEENPGGQRVEAVITLPENMEGHKKLTVCAVLADKKKEWFRVSCQELLARRGKPQFYMEEEHINHKEGTLILKGWVAAPSHVKIRLFDENRKPVKVKVRRTIRMDVKDLFKECPVEKETGFYIELEEIKGKFLYLVMRGEDGSKSIYPVGLGRKEILFGRAEKYRRKGMYYLRTHGMKALAVKAVKKYRDRSNRPVNYSDWLPKHLPTAKELEQQRKECLGLMPKISIVVPVREAKPLYLFQLIKSVKEQTYTNWELCFSGGNETALSVQELLEKCAREDERIKAVFHDQVSDLAENTNEAVSSAAGEYIAFAGCHDILPAHTLYEYVRMINEHPQAQVIYCDEDKMTVGGTRFFMPHFKPDFDPDLLYSFNYIGHLFMAKKELLDKVGPLCGAFREAADYDLILRCTEAADNIYHIPKILYHERSFSESKDRVSREDALEGGRKAVQAHFDRMGVKAKVSLGEEPGVYRTRYVRDHDPLISIIIPNKDHIEDLERCISSIEKKSTYRNFEYIIVENNSTDQKTFSYYKILEAKNPAVHVVYWDGPFNYSEINNYAASFAKGEYLLLLNNDTEVISEDWLEEMLGYCMRPDVGIVGARLYYEDDTIQHAGVVLGFGEIAGHAFVQQPRGTAGYQNRIICAQDYSAVTAACMMVKRSVFDQVGGLSPELAVAFNDVDFCLKVRKAGYLVVYNPYVELYHYESKSRGLEDTPQKQERFGKEIATLEGRWPEVFSTTDPYYNPNLTLKRQDFSLKRL